jgi:transposase
MSVYVGIDVHRKRSQLAVIDAKGEVLANRNVPNGAEPILKVIGGLPTGTPAAFEAAFGTSWLVELLEDYGFDPHLVHPSRCKAIASARLKNDKVDAAILAQLLRADLLPEAWIAPPPVRQLRALLRHRVALVRLRTRLRTRIHAIVADHGHDRPAGGYWTGPGRAPAHRRRIHRQTATRRASDSGAVTGPGGVARPPGELEDRPEPGHRPRSTN